MTSRQRVFLGGARRDDHPPGADEVGADPKEEADIAGASCNYRIEPVRRFSYDGFEPVRDELRSCEGKLPNRRREERRPALSGFDHRQYQSGIHELEGNTGDTGAGACVEHIPGVRRENATKEQAIEENPLDDPPRVARTEQSVNLLPFYQ